MMRKFRKRQKTTCTLPLHFTAVQYRTKATPHQKQTYKLSTVTESTRGGIDRKTG